MTFEQEFWAYLNAPCEADDCSRFATHDQDARAVCDEHLDRAHPAFARND